MPIGSHIIPKLYLEQFSTPSTMVGKDKPGRLWVYERGQEPDERATSVQGVENGYFGYVKPDASLVETFETELAKLESDCAEVLVWSKSDLFNWQSTAHRNKIASFAALLFSRSTQRRDSNLKMWLAIQAELKVLAGDDKAMDELANEFSERFGKSITAALVRDRLQVLLDRAATSAAGKNEFLAGLLMLADSVKESLLKKPWQVWKASTGSEFVTSDNPVCTFVDLGEGLFHPGYGVEYPNVRVAFPLAPTTCLLMGVSGREFARKHATAVMKVNEVIARLAGRFVYSQQYSEEVRKMVDEFGGTFRYGENAFVPIGMPAVREYVRRWFGLQGRIEVPNE